MCCVDSNYALDQHILYLLYTYMQTVSRAIFRQIGPRPSPNIHIRVCVRCSAFHCDIHLASTIPWKCSHRMLLLSVSSIPRYDPVDTGALISCLHNSERFVLLFIYHSESIHLLLLMSFHYQQQHQTIMMRCDIHEPKQQSIMCWTLMRCDVKQHSG